jgi:putative spermidine/putrescine transport system permease protein
MSANFVSNTRRIWLFAITALIILFLTAPVLVVAPMSFSDSRYLDFPPSGWSLRWYVRFFTAIEWYSSLLVSLKVAAATAVIATPIGVAAAYGLHVAQSRMVQRIRAMLLLPLLVPHIVLAIGLFYIYVRIHILGSFWSIVLAHAMLAVPFVVITTAAGLRGFDMTQEMVARSLGCSRLSAFLKVTLPQIMGSVLSGVLFAFVASLDEVVIALFVATGDNETVTKVMFASLSDEIDPTITAVSTMLIFASLTLAGLVALSQRVRIRA